MKKAEKIILGLLVGIILSISHQFLVVPINKFNVTHHLQEYATIVSTMTFILYSMFLFYKTENKKINKLKVFFILFLDICLLISNSFVKTGNLSYIYGGILNILYTIILLALNYIVLKRTLLLIEELVTKYKVKEIKNKFVDIFDKHPFIISFSIIFISFIIFMIAFYPIILSPDPSFQIKQFFNVRTKYADYANLLDETVFLTNHHPVVHTLLLGGCLKLGRILINDNFGLFIYSFIQSIFLASTLAYTIKYLKDNKCSNKILLVLLGIYAFVPMYAMYAVSGVKDTIYTCFVMWYVIFLDKIVRTKKISTKEIVLFIAVLIGVELFRNNGIYVIILSLPFAIVYSKELRKKLFIVFLISISFYGVFDKVILPYYKITPGSVRETLSIPFQQTARYVKYYDEDLTKKEIKVIDKVLDYDTIADRYNPTLADPVKNKYNKDATSEDLKEYLKVWFKCFFRHPLVYIEATLHNIYGYFSPQQTNWYVYFKYDTRITQDNLVNYHYNKLGALRMLLSGYGQGYPYLPIIGLLANIGFNTWVLLGLALYSILKKKKELLIVLSPLLVSLLICIASPANTYFRYTMPYVFMLPSLFILFCKRFKEQ